jgi:hypothetical protein
VARQRPGRKWSAKVTETSESLDLEEDVFKSRSAKRIAASLKRAAEHSHRRKASPFQSAMSGREVELKLEVPPSAIDKVARLPWLSEVASGPVKHEKLVTVYFDTAKSKLRQHDLALRVHHIGADRVQTIKAPRKAARGAFGRDEWEERIAGDKPNLKLAKGTAL